MEWLHAAEKEEEKEEEERRKLRFFFFFFSSLCSSYVMSHVEDGMQVTKMWERGDEGNTTESRSFVFSLF